MKQIKLDDFEIIPILESAIKRDMSDEEYFSSKFKHYVSNSGLGLLNPEQGGSYANYKNPQKLSTQSLSLGSSVHELILQPETFTLGPKCGKPTAKLGATLDRIKYYRKQGESIYDSIVKASKDCDYYVKSIDSKIRFIIESGFKYYWNTKDYDENTILLSDYDYDCVKGCVDSVSKFRKIQNLIHPTDVFGDDIPVFNEDALFLDVLVTYKNRCIKLPIKIKIDSWSIDGESKTITLNDLKTTSGMVKSFMEREHSFYNFRYYRQFAFYTMVLKQYLIREFGYNEKEWTFKGNVMVVNTRDYYVDVFPVTEEHLKEGKEEYEKLLKMLAFYEMFGNDTEVEFV